MSSMGMTWALPPPAAPPFMPKHGPSEGSRRQTLAGLPMRFSPSQSPMLVVVLPSPAGVGVMAVTSTSLPVGLPSKRWKRSSETLALYLP